MKPGAPRMLGKARCQQLYPRTLLFSYPHIHLSLCLSSTPLPTPLSTSVLFLLCHAFAKALGSGRPSCHGICCLSFMCGWARHSRADPARCLLLPMRHGVRPSCHPEGLGLISKAPISSSGPHSPLPSVLDSVFRQVTPLGHRPVCLHFLKRHPNLHLS